MTVAFLFPGQGTEMARAAVEWRQRSPGVRRLLDAAARETGVSAERVLAGGGRALAATELLQPFLTALCVGIHAELDARGVRPGAVAGHSLGEVAACAAAGCMTADAAVAVAAARGRLMAREADRHPGGMLALAATERAVAEEAVAASRSRGYAEIAGQNTPDQWLVSGEWPVLRAIAARHAAAPVPVAGPWHSRAMADAVEEYRHALRAAVTVALRVPFVCNRTGFVVERTADVPGLLAEQLTHAVQWVRTVATLGALGVATMVIVGPAKTLRGMMRSNLGAAAAIRAVETPEDLERVGEALAG